MALLVTGGMGFIGSHTVVELLNAGYEVIILDNLSNSKQTVLDAIQTITGRLPPFYQGDVRDEAILGRIFSSHEIEGVFHFAAKKSVGESCENPREYYSYNLGGLQSVTNQMNTYGCKKIVFSSSCTVYDASASKAPYRETSQVGNCFSPYGTTKYVSELLLRDLSLHQGFSAINLRYFNPIGAHSSGLLGEDPSQPPTNLLPVIFQVLQGKRAYLEIFGDSYETPDGTCLRDYIHVVDLAEAHVEARKRMKEKQTSLLEVINLGTGTPTSVKELVAIAEKVTTQSINIRVVNARSGDIPIAYAQTGNAKEVLGRVAKKSISDAVCDGWKFITT